LICHQYLYNPEVPGRFKNLSGQVLILIFNTSQRLDFRMDSVKPSRRNRENHPHDFICFSFSLHFKPTAKADGSNRWDGM